jgi:hypothetical protein
MREIEAEVPNYFRIETISQTQRLFLSGVRERIERLDWSYFRVSRKNAGRVFEPNSSLFLAKSGLFPLRLIEINKPERIEALSLLPPHRVLEIGRGRYLVLETPFLVGREKLQLGRDLFFVSSIEQVSECLGIDRPGRVIITLAQEDPDLEQDLERIKNLASRSLSFGSFRLWEKTSELGIN